MSDDPNKKNDDLPEWLRGSLGDTPPADDADDAAAFDWQADDAAAAPQPGGTRTGVTGELPWLAQFGDQPSDPVDRAEAELFDWMNAPQSDAPAAAPASGVPDWLQATPAAPPEEPTLPDWLADESAAPAPATDSGFHRSDDFLALADTLPETADSDLTYDAWMREQERERSGPDLEEETPDLLSDVPLGAPGTGGLGNTGALAGTTPDWYLGLDALEEDDLPDYLASTPAASADPDDVPDWLQAAAPAAPTAAAGAFDDDDFLAALGVAPEASTSPAASADELPDDLFAALGVAPGGDTSAAASADEPSFDDFFAGSGTATSTAASDAPLDELPDDFFASLGVELPDEKPVTGDLSWSDEHAAAIERQNAPSIPAPRGDDADDFLASLGIGTGTLPPLPALPTTGGDAPDDDPFAGWDLESGFSAAPAPAPTPAADRSSAAGFDFDAPESEPSWLDSIDAADLPAATPAEDDWLQDLSAPVMPPPRPEQPAAFSADPALPTTGELDSFLAGLGAPEDRLPDTGQLLDPNIDLDRLFSPDAFSGFDAPAAVPTSGLGDTLTPMMPDFLEGATVGEVSAASIVRQRKDRPIDDLPDKLRRLHERGETLPGAPAAVIETGDPLAQILPGVSQALAPAPIQPALPTAAAAAAVLTEVQRERLDLLRGLLPADEGRRVAPLSALDLTFDSPYLPDLEDDHEVVSRAQPAALAAPAAVALPAARPRRRRPLAIDRIAIFLILAAAVIAPFFVPALRIGSLPPAAFAPASAQMRAFERIDALAPGDYVLLAAEYSPAVSGELDELTRAIFLHALSRGAHPVVVSTNATGLLHVGNLLDAAYAAQPGTASAQRPPYTVVRFLPAGALGVRGLGETTASTLGVNVRGVPTNLPISSLNDFAAVVVIAERADDLRVYAEQIAPLLDSRIIAATTSAALPFVTAYNTDGAGIVEGALAGYRDAYTYSVMLGIIPPPPAALDAGAQSAETDEAAPLVTDEPTDEPTAAPTSTPRPTNTPRPTSTPRPTATELPLALQIATLDAMGTATRQAERGEPTNTPRPTDTASPTATDTPTPTASRTPLPTSTPTVTPTQYDTQIGVITSTQSVNVRAAPTTDAGVLEVVLPGLQIEVIGENAAADWYLIRVRETGTEGWVAAQLVRIIAADDNGTPQAAIGKLRFLRPALQTTDEPSADADATPDATPDATADADATADVTPTPTPRPTVTPIPPTLAPMQIGTGGAYRDERWFAMTLGTVVAVVVISFGAVVNIVRALFRRRRQRDTTP